MVISVYVYISSYSSILYPSRHKRIAGKSLNSFAEWEQVCECDIFQRIVLESRLKEHDESHSNGTRVNLVIKRKHLRPITCSM